MTLRGMTLIDVIVGSAIMLVVFLSIFAAFKLSIELVYNTKAKIGAVSLVTERMEYLRGLPYDSVGTAGGIPAGPVAQLEQRSLNAITYTVRTLIQYEDSAEDGLGDDDENAVTADYKTVKVEVLWSVKGSGRSVSAVTRVAPPGMETLAGGGTLRVNVVDAALGVLPGASVRIVNAAAVPAIDVTVLTNDAGSVAFPGAPEAAGYQITVTKNGYSTAQTYGQSGSNPNPSPTHISVLEMQTSTITLSIDRLAALTVRTFEPPEPGEFEDLFADGSKVSVMTGVEIVGGSLIMGNDVNGYLPGGEAYSVAVSPPYLSSWDEMAWSASTSPSSTILVRAYYFDGAAYVPVPDADLPGNAAGFATGPVDLSGLSVQTYDVLELVAFLTTTDSAVSPELLDWSVSYIAGPTPLPNAAFDIRGSKTIGTDAGFAPIYKYAMSLTTAGNGVRVINPIEWDTSYFVTVPASSPYVLYERCPNELVIDPDEDAEVSLTLAPKTAHSLRVIAESSDAPVADATITLTGGAVNESRSSSACGQALFDGISAGMYTVSVSKTGYQPHSEDVILSGAYELSIDLAP